MKTIVGIALACLLSVSPFANSQPDKDWWACQFIESGGLIWKDRAWTSTKFTLKKPFVLVADGAGLLKLDSVANALGSDEMATTCTNKNVDGHIFCPSRWSGASFSFDPKTGTGGTARIPGAFEDLSSSNRASLNISVFECAKG